MILELTKTETQRYLSILKPGILFHVSRGLQLFQEFYPGYLNETFPEQYPQPPPEPEKHESSRVEPKPID
jgi:hypothetical protein